MNNIELNFVPLIEQNISTTIFRKPVLDNTLAKSTEDMRVRLPEQSDDIDWPFFDISIIKKEGYEPYIFEYIQNHILSVNLIYQEFIKNLESQDTVTKYYISKSRLALKEVHFVTEEYDEGNTEFIVKPYYLKIKKEFGFLVTHKFSLNDDQPYNRQTQIRSLSLDKSGRSNIYFYKDKKRNIETFIKKILFPLLSNSNLNIHSNFSSLSTEKLSTKTYLVGQQKTSRSQFMGIKVNGPYRKVTEDVRYLFIFNERTISLARDIYLGLFGRLFPSQFPGLNPMFSTPISKENVEHYKVSTFDDETIKNCEKRVQRIKAANSNEKIMVIAVLPKGFKGIEAAFDAYGYLKLMALKNDVCCQVVTEDTFFKKDLLKWSISNIGLQIFSKLGGTPWLVRPAKTDCLIFGIGNVQERINGSIERYAAYTVCLDSSGDFKYIKPLASSKSESAYLDSLQIKLKEVLLSELGEHYKSFVLHLPYKIKRNEIEVIKSAVSEVRGETNFEVIVIKVNTLHRFFGFSDHNTSVPYESTCLPISSDEFLVWTDGLKYQQEALHKRVSEPLYVNFIESQGNQVVKKECLQDILNLAGANWRGFNSNVQPISILYSKLVARFMKNFSEFDDIGDINFLSAKSTSPWFL